MSPDDRVTVEQLAPGDDAALERLLGFAAEHGTPRATSAAAYRDLMRETVAVGRAHGEEATALMVGALPDRIRNGEYNLDRLTH